MHCNAQQKEDGNAVLSFVKASQTFTRKGYAASVKQQSC